MSLKKNVKKILAQLGFIHPSLGIKISREKKAEMLTVLKKPEIKVFIETGTETGWMIEKIGLNFEKIYSIELDNNLYNKAVENFKGQSKISIFHGDSAVEIKKILGELSGLALFWLDAHGSGEITSENSPIIGELEAIFNHQIKGHPILIDDARHFDLKTIETIKKMAYQNNYTFRIEDGIFKLTSI